MDPSPATQHRADALFALPRLPKSAAVFGDAPGWAGDLPERGVEMVAVRGSRGDRRLEPDLAVATPETAAAAYASGAQSVIVDGSRSGHRTLRRMGLGVTRLLSLPLRGSPAVFLDLDQPRAASWGMRHGRATLERRKVLRNHAVAGILKAGALPPLLPLVTLGARRRGGPALLAGARELGAEPDATWMMVVSPGSVVRRNAFLLFPRRGSTPTQVLKFARIPGFKVQFDREERGFAAVSEAGRLVARHAPTFLGRTEIDGHHVSLETAAVGLRLSTFLRRPGSRSAKLRAVDAVARWLIEVARETASSPQAFEPERARLAREVISFWAGHGAPTGLVDELPPVPGVFRHNDLADENVVIGRDGFTVLDWEWARPRALPFGDLVFFAARALRIVDGALSEAERMPHFVRLFSGQSQGSAVLFGWIQALRSALSIPPESVGPLVTLYWLERGKQGADERARAESASGRRLERAFSERAALAWLAEPALGAGWSAWRSG